MARNVIPIEECPPVERLRELFLYDPETGVVTRRINSGPAKAGDTAGGPNGKGYMLVRVSWGETRRKYLLSRVIWALQTGSWPPPSHEIDHKDHDRQNNRWGNFRLVLHVGNSRNRKLNKNSTSGYPGVRPGVCKSRWMARGRRYVSPGKDASVYLGTYDTKEEAIAARKAWERENDFHENHGKKKVDSLRLPLEATVLSS